MNLNTHFLIDIELANRYMKRCSTSLLIRESPTKITRTYHLIPVRIAIIKKKYTCWWGCGGGRRTLVHCGKVYCGKYILWESILIHMLWKIVWSFLKKFKKRKYLTIQQFHYQVLSKADELILSKGYLHSHVHCTHTLRYCLPVVSAGWTCWRWC